MKVAEKHTAAYGTLYYVKDMAKSVKYYKDCFEWQPLFENPEWTEFDVNGHRLCLHGMADGQSATERGILITAVKDIESVVAELKGRGVEFVNEVHEVCENGFSADYKDPNGNLLSLFEYKGN